MPENYDDYIRTVADLTARGYGASLDSGGGKMYLRNGKGEVISEAEQDGIPSGGSAGQVLSKASAADGDFMWATPSGGVTDYADLTGKPSIDGVTLVDDKTFPELGVFIEPEEEHPRSDEYALTNAELDAIWADIFG